jgi:hypothetical protein
MWILVNSPIKDLNPHNHEDLIDHHPINENPRDYEDLNQEA